MNSMKTFYNRAVRTGIGAASIPWCEKNYLMTIVNQVMIIKFYKKIK